MNQNKAAHDPFTAYKKHRRLVRLGQVIMAIGVLVALSHWLGHVGTFGNQPNLSWDIFLGYPTGIEFFLIGAVLARRRK